MAVKTYQDKTLSDIRYLALVRLAQSFGAIVGRTIAIDSSDTVQSLPDLSLNGDAAVAVIISIDTQDIRYAYNTAPSATFGHLLKSSEQIEVVGSGNILSFKFVNAAAGQNGVLVVTPKY